MSQETPKSPEEVLVYLKNNLCLALGLSASNLKGLVDKYVRERMHTTGPKTHYTRVNTYNEFTTDKMTIKVFFKFLQILSIQSIEFRIKVKTRVGREVEVVQFVPVTPPDPNVPDEE